MSKEHRAVRAAETKLYVGPEKTRRLAAQIKGSYRKIDDSLAQILRLHADMLDTAQEIGLEPETGQKLFSNLAACAGSMVTSRDQLLTAHRRATAIRMRTDQAVEYDGTWITSVEPNVVALSSVA